MRKQPCILHHVPPKCVSATPILHPNCRPQHSVIAHQELQRQEKRSLGLLAAYGIWSRPAHTTQTIPGQTMCHRRGGSKECAHPHKPRGQSTISRFEKQIQTSGISHRLPPFTTKTPNSPTVLHYVSSPTQPPHNIKRGKHAP